MFLWHIISRNKTELIRKVYEVQKLCPTKGDWSLLIDDEKENTVSTCQIKKFRTSLKNTIYITEFAHRYLLDIAKTQSKCSNILNNLNTEQLVTQQYLQTVLLYKEEQQLLFSLRSRSYPVKSNFKTQYVGDNMTCRICADPSSYEDEIHLTLCSKLKCETDGQPLDFNDVFGPLPKQIKFIKQFSSNKYL